MYTKRASLLCPRTLLIGVLALPTILGLTSCATVTAANKKAAAAVVSWWNNPSTQKGVQVGLQAAGAAFASGITTAGIDYMTTGSVQWTDVGKAAGSSALRQIELTETANKPVAAAAQVADAVLQCSHDPAQAQATKTAVIAALTSAQASGANASGALEGVAQKLDAQKTTTSTPTLLGVPLGK